MIYNFRLQYNNTCTVPFHFQVTKIMSNPVGKKLLNQLDEVSSNCAADLFIISQKNNTVIQQLGLVTEWLRLSYYKLYCIFVLILLNYLTCKAKVTTYLGMTMQNKSINNQNLVHVSRLWLWSESMLYSYTQLLVVIKDRHKLLKTGLNTEHHNSFSAFKSN